MDYTLPELDDWCTLAVGAMAEDVSYPTLLNWVRTGRLPAVKLGRSYLVRRDALARVAAESKRFYGGQRRGGLAAAARRAAAGTASQNPADAGLDCRDE